MGRRLSRLRPFRVWRAVAERIVPRCLTSARRARMRPVPAGERPDADGASTDRKSWGAP